MKDLPKQDAYAAIGELQGLHMQVSMMRKTIDLLKAMQEHDESLLRQALDALDSENPDVQLRAAIAIRARLGDPA